MNDFMATGLSTLCNRLNKTLEWLNVKATTICQKDGKIDFVTPNTHAIGLKAIGSSAYLTEFNTTDSACRFHDYTNKEWTAFKDLFGENMQTIGKAFNLIVH
ncbi:hypothetical protein C0989_004702 [Termitomyces sp. Mn162]|nr:hypothetical protein C0989_004702 [Termitomyces sp. Mn162]